MVVAWSWSMGLSIFSELSALGCWRRGGKVVATSLSGWEDNHVWEVFVAGQAFLRFCRG